MDAEQIIAAVSAEPTLNELLRRDPRGLTREDRRSIVALMREQRAAWLTKQAEREDRKAEKEEEE